MNTKIKKISVIVYCNGNFEETKKTLYSVMKQDLDKFFYEIIILNDNANKIFTNHLNNFIKVQELECRLFSLKGYSGLPMSINFLLKNKIINCEYMTIVKSGDVILSAWLDNFYNNLYQLNMDLYLFDLKDEFIIPKNKIERNGQKYVISKSKLIMPFTPGYVDTNIALVIYPLFLGKIWRTSNVMNIILDDDKILYQDIFMFFQMILLSNSIWYTKEFAGVIRRHSWIPEQMDSRRIELLSLTLNKMISRNPYVNGQVLQLLALALKNTPKEDRGNYILTNNKYLQNNYIILRSYNLSKRKILKLTKPFIEHGEIPKKEE